MHSSTARSLSAIFCGLLVGAVACAQQITATLPNGRELHPEGSWITTAPYPFALAVRPDGKQIVVPCIGFPFALTVIDNPQSSTPVVRRIPLEKPDDPQIQVHTGVVYSPDSAKAYVASGDTGFVDVYETVTWRRAVRMSLDGLVGKRMYQDSFAASLVLDVSGEHLYVLDQANWRVVILDTHSHQLLDAVPTGVNPIALCLSPDNTRLYIANSGLFEYSLLSGIDRNHLRATGLRFAPFGYPSRQARQGVHARGRQVQGLGDENSGRGSSLWTYQLTSGSSFSRNPTVLRLGSRIVETKNGVMGGAAPSAVVAGRDHVYVALAHADRVSVASPDGQVMTEEISLTPFPLAGYHDAASRPLRGVMPSGLAIGDKRLFVTEAGINAVAVINTDSNAVIRQAPVGWNPSAVAASSDGQSLYVVNTKGKGTGPNGGEAYHGSPEHSYIGELAFGSVSVLQADAPDATASVVRSNEAAISTSTALPRLEHVFLIIRENRTFDEVFGDLANSQGDPSLARYGLHGWTEEKPVLRDLQVTPNAHALATQFATGDNFYADSDVSADGHRWILGIAPTPWMNIAWTSHYGGRRTSSAFSVAPGRRAFSGGADSPMPEDEPEFGSLWEHIVGSGLRLLNYGEGLEIEGSDEKEGFEPEGQRNLLNAPLPKPIFEATDRRYPTFNLGIPDQLRFAEFKNHFSKQLKRDTLPALVVIRLPNDHTASIRPPDGYPYRASFIADNDLALGRIIEFLSQTPIWDKSAVFVTEDDAQGGRDHIDAHRTVLLVASPWVRKGAISHQHTSFASIQKTIYRLLGLGPLNLEDALAADLSDLFQAKPTAGPFHALPADHRIFDPARAKVATPKTKAEKAELLQCDNPISIARQMAKEQR